MLRLRVPLIEEVRGPLHPDRFRLPNAPLIQPLFHGDDCVGLSGVYSIINAIRLVLAHRHEFDGPGLHELLTASFRFMDGRLSPTRTVTSGLRVSIWRALAEAMTHHVRERHRALVFADRVYADPATDRLSAVSMIEQNVRSYRAVLVLMRGGRYTVISGYTPSSLLLFDSNWSCWISKRVTGVPHDCEGSRHVIHPTSLLTLRA